MNEAVDYILKVAALVAPTEEVQDAFDKMYRDMLGEGTTWDSVVSAFANAIADGLTKGDWPA
jgi:hypothetical protein